MPMRVLVMVVELLMVHEEYPAGLAIRVTRALGVVIHERPVECEVYVTLMTDVVHARILRVLP